MKALLSKMLKERADILKRKPDVSLLGFGGTNKALLDILLSCEDVGRITVRQKGLINDRIPDTVSVLNGDEAFAGLCEDVFFPSPSVRRERLSFPENSVSICDYDLLFSINPDKLFTVSGSDGKSTTVNMAAELLFPRFPKIFTGGNIGVPLWSANADIDAFLLELSSFTLRYSTPRGGRALLTNVTPNHLDWHSDLTEYEETKLSLIRSADEPILNLDDPVSEKEAKATNSFCLVSLDKTAKDIRKNYRTEHTLTAEDGAIKVDGKTAVVLTDVKNRERHNLYNLASAIALTLGYADSEQIKSVATNYTMLQERCESFTDGKVHYISSSIDTTPLRTRTTLVGLGKKVRLILGGRGKGLSLAPLTDVLKTYATRIAIYGEMSDELLEYLSSDKELDKIPHCAFTKLDGAIDYALDGIEEGEMVVLSPAATSYGEFTDYKQRGEYFKARVLRSHTNTQE